MTVSTEVKNKIIEDLENGVDKVVISRGLRVDLTTIEILAIEHYRLYNYTEEGYGPDRLRRHVVARRSAFKNGGWDNANPAIKTAREQYERGEVELSTGRDGQWLILYAIPRLSKLKRDNYFDTSGA